jgi:hypothetical protein
VACVSAVAVSSAPIVTVLLPRSDAGQLPPPDALGREVLKVRVDHIIVGRLFL